MTEEVQTDQDTPVDQNDAVELTETFINDLPVASVNYIPLIITDSASLQKVLEEAVNKAGGPDKFVAEASRPETAANIILAMFQNATAETDRTLGVLAKDGDKVANKIATSDYALGIKSLISNPKKSDTPNVLKGAEAIATAIARTKLGGIKRFPFFNSGLSMKLASPTNVMMDQFINTVRLDVQEMGRLLGGLYYLFADYKIKLAAFDVFSSCITGTSIASWRNRDVLLSNFKLNDFNVFMTYLAYLINIDGYDDFKHVCRNCDVVISGKVDVSKMVLTNFSMMNEDARKLMAVSSTDNSPGDTLSKYHNELGFTGTVDTIEKNGCRIGTYGILFEVPSLEKYFSSCERFDAKISQGYQSIDVSRQMLELPMHTYRQYAPWIKEIVLYIDENSNEIDSRIYDSETIESLLDYIYTSDSKQLILKEKVESYIERTQLTHIGYNVPECPHCKHQYENSFVTVDPISMFFIMCSQKIREALGAQNTEETEY